LFFIFLSLTSVVGVIRDLDNASLSLATAWNVTNTLIIATFLFAAVREGREQARPSPVPQPVALPPRTIVARPSAATPSAPTPADPEPGAELALVAAGAAKKEES